MAQVPVSRPLMMIWGVSAAPATCIAKRRVHHSPKARKKTMREIEVTALTYFSRRARAHTHTFDQNHGRLTSRRP